MLYNIFLSGDDVIMKKRILNITFAALFTAITAALSQAAIPTPFGGAAHFADLCRSAVRLCFGH